MKYRIPSLGSGTVAVYLPLGIALEHGQIYTLDGTRYKALVSDGKINLCTEWGNEWVPKYRIDNEGVSHRILSGTGNRDWAGDINITELKPEGGESNLIESLGNDPTLDEIALRAALAEAKDGD